MGENFAPLVW